MKKILLFLVLTIFITSCNGNKAQIETNIISKEDTQNGVVPDADSGNKDDFKYKTNSLDNFEEQASDEESSCETVGKSYLDNNITNNTEAVLSYYKTFEINTTESACLVAYKYITEGRHYWNVYDISAGDELYNDSCIPSYDVENDVMTYCSEQDITLKEKGFKEYVEFGIGKFRKD